MTRNAIKIPDGWCVKKLGDLSVSSLSNGVFKDPKNVGTGTKLINVVNLYDDCIDFEKLERVKISDNDLKKACVKEGDILFTRSSLKEEGIAHCNIVKNYKEDVVYECHIIRLSPDKNEVNPFYLLRLCQSQYVHNQLIKSAKTTTMTTIDQKGIASVKVFYPPLAEQEKIADILGCWDSAIEKLTALIDAKKQRKKALMQKLLTAKIRLLGFTDEWKKVEISELLNYEQPTSYLVKKVEAFEKNKIPVLTANKSFIIGSTNDTCGVYDKSICIIFDDFTTDMKFVDFSFKVKSSAIKILTAKPNVNIKFVFEQMRLIKFSLGGHKRYYLSEYQYIPIPIPSLPEQQAIADILFKADEEIDLLTKKLSLIQEQKKGLMQKLLTGQIRVKVA